MNILKPFDGIVYKPRKYIPFALSGQIISTDGVESKSFRILSNNLSENVRMRRQSETYQVSQKQKRLNDQAPNSYIKAHRQLLHKVSRAKLNEICRYKMTKKTRQLSKSFCKKPEKYLQLKRSESVSQLKQISIIIPLSQSLNRKIDQLINQKRCLSRKIRAQARQSTLLISKERLIKFKELMNQKFDASLEEIPEFDQSIVLKKSCSKVFHKESILRSFTNRAIQPYVSHSSKYINSQVSIDCNYYVQPSTKKITLPKLHQADRTNTLYDFQKQQQSTLKINTPQRIERRTKTLTNEWNGSRQKINLQQKLKPYLKF